LTSSISKSLSEDDIAYLSAVYIMDLFVCSDKELSTGIACTTSQTAV
jgi:hypothetical protein